MKLPVSIRQHTSAYVLRSTFIRFFFWSSEASISDIFAIFVTHALTWATNSDLEIGASNLKKQERELSTR
jgi:hypothetical protein